ncbi:nuclear transport factor 2 family protein [Flavisolibacter sp. BT320]|nr:nuclear transport factor 2 family protein [Flavisolibacter longurius]
MATPKIIPFFIAACFTFFALTASAQKDDEKQKIERAILNYVEAFYEADTTKAYESVAKDLAKRGYYKAKDGSSKEAKMSFEQLVKLAQRWKASQNITDATPRKITVFEILDRIATAKVEAQWGIDYFHLAKQNGKWTIINVLWQDYPAKN